MISHGSVPFAEPLGSGLFRIWFSPRDAQNRSYVGWLVIDIADPTKVLDLAEQPILGPGTIGGFDDCGAMMSWLTEHSGKRTLYYIGWNVRKPIPFHVSIGAAAGQTDDPLRFEHPEGPILDRRPADPIFCSNPCVLADGDRLRMWYLTGLGWEQRGEAYSASYQVAYAESIDGISWNPSERPAVPIEGNEFAIARPSVLRTRDGWRMWFCHRGRDYDYRLGAAVSEDGLSWRRDPGSSQLEPGVHDWASGMIAYPHVFEHDGKLFMLYCGDGFGRTGFGIATID